MMKNSVEATPPPEPCSKCQGTQIRIDPTAEPYAQATPCPACVPSPCLACGDTRFQLQKDQEGREVAVPCPECEIYKRRIKLYNHARIPKSYAESQFSRTERNEHNEKIYHLLISIINLFHQPREGPKGLVLMGQTGTGKTHLMAGFAYQCLIHQGISCTFQRFDKLLSELREGYSTGKPETEIIAPLLVSDFLVIDDLGKGRNTAWELNVLDMLITERYNNNKAIMVTSNYTENEATTYKERILTKDKNDEERFIFDTLRKRVGERIYSRLREMCYFETLAGPDRRVVKLGASVTLDGSS